MSCRYKCAITRNGTRCYCGDGYETSSDGRSCTVTIGHIPEGIGYWDTAASLARLEQVRAFSGAQTSSQPIPVSRSPDLAARRPWRTPGMLPHAHKDLNECNTYGSCSQMCVNTDGSYTCSCVEGYVLQPDNKSCKAKNEPADRPPLLLVASSETIEVLYLNGSKMSTRTPVKGSSILTLDYSYKEDTVCWIESRDLSSQLKCTKIMKTGELTDEWIINIAQYLHSGSKQMPLMSIPTFCCLMVKVERLILH
ncbi:hypothetical protein Q9966_015104 [Columba livia]|nr:hypothetical protein Q9966_015104 [Columba livia]